MSRECVLLVAGSARLRCLAWILLLASATVLLYVFTAPPVLIMGPKMLTFNNPNPTSARNSSIPGEVPVPLNEDSLLECPLDMPELVQGHSPSAGCKSVSAAEASSLLASTLGGTFKPAVLFPALKTAGPSKLDIPSLLILTLQAMLMLVRQFPTWLGVALASVAYILYIRVGVKQNLCPQEFSRPPHCSMLYFKRLTLQEGPEVCEPKLTHAFQICVGVRDGI